jgi:hypothetical protein
MLGLDSVWYSDRSHDVTKPASNNNIYSSSHKYNAAETKTHPKSKMSEPHTSTNPNPPSKDTASPKAQPPQHHTKDSSTIHTKVDHDEYARKHKTPKPSSSEPASASAVNTIMGPPPPPEDKKVSRWERWRRDRREARELGMPSGGSSRRWRVGNVVS